MYCPTCGRDNSADLKFCASCGTNLEAVSLALTGREEDVVTRLDNNLDHFLSRYTEHVFKDPAPGETSVVRSWKLLGQAFVTTLVDLFLFSLMWNILPLRFLLLLITSPFRLLSEKNQERDSEKNAEQGYSPPELERPGARRLAPGAPSVTEGTTTNLKDKITATKNKVPITDKLEDGEK